MSLDQLASLDIAKIITSPALYATGVLLTLSYLTYLIAKRFLPKALIKVTTHRKPDWKKVFEKNKAFNQLVYMVPVLFIYFSTEYLPDAAHHIHRVLNVYIIINVILLIENLLNVALDVYALYPISREKPIKSYIQLVKLFLYIIGAILGICFLLDKEVLPFISGIGALTAILMLVFRDTILSFIASMQLAANQMISKGDWVEIPQYGADGDVIDVALHVIKIQNFDKTIVTVPTHKLMEIGFKNWRGMYEGGGRRIKRSLLIDQTSVHFMSDKDIKSLLKNPTVSKYLKDMNTSPKVDAKIVKVESAERNMADFTNLTIFRRYVKLFLESHPHISDDMTFIVRLLDPTPSGIPMELYIFSKEKDWAVYEHIQASIFEHLMAIIPAFGLKVFQNPATHNFAALSNAVIQEKKAS